MRRQAWARRLRTSAHASLTLGWAMMVPVAIVTGWLESLVFIAACSIYANFASHLAAWLADETARLRRIEALLASIHEALVPRPPD